MRKTVSETNFALIALCCYTTVLLIAKYVVAALWGDIASVLTQFVICVIYCIIMMAHIRKNMKKVEHVYCETKTTYADRTTQKESGQK